MAVGTIQNAPKLDLARMTPQQVEASATNMRLLSLIVLTNNVRQDSKETIAHLQDRYACPILPLQCCCQFLRHHSHRLPIALSVRNIGLLRAVHVMTCTCGSTINVATTHACHGQEEASSCTALLQYF